LKCDFKKIITNNHLIFQPCCFFNADFTSFGKINGFLSSAVLPAQCQFPVLSGMNWCIFPLSSMV